MSGHFAHKDTHARVHVPNVLPCAEAWVRRRPPHTEGHLDTWTLVLFDKMTPKFKLQSLPCRVILPKSEKEMCPNVPPCVCGGVYLGGVLRVLLHYAARELQYTGGVRALVM